MSGLLPRLLEPAVGSMLDASPVVVLEGGRAVGKSTLCDRLIAVHGWAARLDLADDDILETLRLDPVRFLTAQPTPCVLDEAQLEPRLPVWIKRVVDERRGPGQFLLTGSARLGREQLGGSDPLAGRAIRLRMWSMTQRELAAQPSDFVSRCFGDGWAVGPVRASTRERARLGGLPGIAGVRTSASAAQWERAVAAYVESVLPLGAAGTRADLGRLLRTFRYLAANSGQLLNLARAASELGIQANTVRSHLELLEAGFLLFRVEASRPSEHKVVTAHPRVYASDVGLATWASRAWSGRLSARVVGALNETLVAHDIVAQADADLDRVVLRHWRDDRNQREVDLLLVHPDGRLVPIEVKASSAVGPGDTSGLTTFAETAGAACARAIVIYDGNRVVDLTPSGGVKTFAVPRSLV